MNVEGIDLRLYHGVWIGDIRSASYGQMEVMLDGTRDAPKAEHVAALKRFIANLDENITSLRKRLSWSLLYRPIRIAPNNDNRVGVQFKNRLTGYQGNLILQ